MFPVFVVNDGPGAYLQSDPQDAGTSVATEDPHKSTLLHESREVVLTKKPHEC